MICVFMGSILAPDHRAVQIPAVRNCVYITATTSIGPGSLVAVFK